MAFGKYSKLFTRPRKAFDKPRIEGENLIVKKYGLKNKREIWKAESEIDKIRRQAKKLITADKVEQDVLLNRLKKIGLSAEKISDVLALDKEDWLKRRLQTLVFQKKLATTPKSARQLIVHKKITIDKKVVNIPGYIVKIKEEGKINIKVKKQTPIEKKGDEKNE